MSPTSPMMVRTTPLDTFASPPTASTLATTCAMSASVASGRITTTMGSSQVGQATSSGHWTFPSTVVIRVAGPGPMSGCGPDATLYLGTDVGEVVLEHPAGAVERDLPEDHPPKLAA